MISTSASSLRGSTAKIPRLLRLESEAETVLVFKIRWRGDDWAPRNVGRARDQDPVLGCQALCDQSRIGQRPDPDGAIGPARDQIDGVVGERSIDTDIVDVR